MADSIAADQVPKFAPFLGMAGVAFAMIFGSATIHIPTAHSLY
jgi:hypothetical protein